MGVFDKLKNALFEVEYVEVEEKQKKEKPIKPKDKNKDSEDKPIAKKIVLPGKREEKVERIEEEELKDDNFEVRPIGENVKDASPIFKFMDDEDFAVDNNNVSIPSNNESYDRVSEDFRRREEVNTARRSEVEPVKSSYPSNDQVDRINYEDDNHFDRPVNTVNDYVGVGEETNKEHEEDYYSKYDIKPPVSNNIKENKPYGVDNTTFKAAKEYGSYENNEKSYFKPSPIISPIYGILDKNYKKEDVVSKKEIRITTNYSRSNVNVDDIRNKAYGRRSEPEAPIVQEPSFEVEEEEEGSLLVDLSDEKEKPEVKAITVGDAMEYFDDLGLEYNVDYVDASNKSKKKNGIEEEIKATIDRKPVIKRVVEDIPPAPPEIIQSDLVGVDVKTPIVDVKNESNNESLDDEDNLFDLIDSMYKED